MIKMKLKLDKIYSLFRKSHKLVLYNVVADSIDGEKRISKQFLADGYCCYALNENLPTFSESSIAALIGCYSDEISVEVKEQTPFITEIMSDAYNASDRVLTIERYNFFDHTVLSTFGDDEVYFVDPKYIKPFDVGGDIEYCLRLVNDKPIVVIKNGMFVVAAIIPAAFDDVWLTNYLNCTRKVYKALSDMQDHWRNSHDKE